MSRKTYTIGDKITLKAGLFRLLDSDRICSIVGILPSDHGEAQFRVRLGNETYERRIVASDIEMSESAPLRGEKSPSAPKKTGEPWFKPSSIRTTK